jgi:hypothetical protein
MAKRIMWGLAAAAMGGLFLGAQTQLPELPVYEVARTSMPIRVDGVLDEAAWEKAQPLGTFSSSRDGAASSLETVGKVLYDNEFVYFASRFVDENIWATMRNRDEHLWTEEVMEVFLRADPRSTSYIELEVNPLGTLLDIYLVDVRRPLPYRSWNSDKIRWAVKVDGTVDGEPGDREWTCEIALPIEDVVPAVNTPPKPGDRWLFNMYRVEKKPAPAGLAWSPTGGDFHRPNRFGQLVFTDRRVP